jgi:hypothetical protein
MGRVLGGRQGRASRGCSYRMTRSTAYHWNLGPSGLVPRKWCTNRWSTSGRYPRKAPQNARPVLSVLVALPQQLSTALAVQPRRPLPVEEIADLARQPGISSPASSVNTIRADPTSPTSRCGGRKLPGMAPLRVLPVREQHAVAGSLGPGQRGPPTPVRTRQPSEGWTAWPADQGPRRSLSEPC